MSTFISGGAKNGKSFFAQRIAKAAGAPLYYIATMIPHDGEDRARIARHRAERVGWGFETLEVGRDILSCLDRADPKGSFLLDSVTALLSNEMFAPEGIHLDAHIRLADDLTEFVRRAPNTVLVSDFIYSDAALYDELTEALAPYQDKMTIVVSEPLLGEVGADATAINDDKKAVAEAAVAAAVKDAGFASIDEAAEAGTAFVFMGHGTSHTANVTYDQMQTVMDELGYKNVFIGTVEGEPEDTECSVVIGKVKEAGFTKVVLRPLMVVAGDHANNDMADPEDEESWISQFSASGAFDAIECQIQGLGRIADVEALYVAHTGAAIETIG